jgi:hypothetical protein
MRIHVMHMLGGQPRPLAFVFDMPVPALSINVMAGAI